MPAYPAFLWFAALMFQAPVSSGNRRFFHMLPAVWLVWRPVCACWSNLQRLLRCLMSSVRRFAIRWSMWMRDVFNSGFGAAALLVCCALPASAQAETGVQVGRLTCEIAPHVTFLVSSAREMSCRFAPAGKGGTATELKGLVHRYGLDIGFSGKSRMVWNVRAPAAQVTPEDLRGSYLATADGASGAGEGAQALVGGRGGRISLQPVSVSSQAGFNLGLGLTRFTLR